MAAADDGRLLIDAGEVAELLGLTQRQVQALARRGELPCVRIGRWLKFRRESVERWVANREQER